MSSPAGPPSHAVGDVVLVEQGNQLHDARVLELGDGRDGRDVYVHYLGWSAKWDSWARTEHTRADTPHSRAEQATMRDAYAASKSSKKGSKKKREATGVGRDSKALSASEAAAALLKGSGAVSAEWDAESSVASDLIPPLPSSLRRRLVLDWERLTRKQQIQRLPARLPVVMLLTAFLCDHKHEHPAATEADRARQEAVLQVCEGLLCYFERCLPSVLLYRIERPQIQQLAQQHSLTVPSAGQSDSPLFNIQHMARTLPRPPYPAAQPASSTSSSTSSSSFASSPRLCPTAVAFWLPDPATAPEAAGAVCRQWSGVYGVEHLVRMLCKLPAILRDCEADWLVEQRQAVRSTLSLLYRWLSAHDELIYLYSAHEQASELYMAKLQQPHHDGLYNGEPGKRNAEQQHSESAKKLDLLQVHVPNKVKRK